MPRRLKRRTEAKTSPLKKFRELLASPKFIPAMGVWDRLTTKGVSGFLGEMIPWRKECEGLTGLDEYYEIERKTVER